MIYVDCKEEGKLKLRDGKCKVVAIQVVKGMLVKRKPGVRSTEMKAWDTKVCYKLSV